MAGYSDFIIKQLRGKVGINVVKNFDINYSIGSSYNFILLESVKGKLPL